jgi:hypothetical protein
MPITFRVDHEGREIYAVAEGPITLTDIRQHLDEERRAGAVAYRELIDGSKAVVALSTQDVRAIVELLRELGRQGELGPTAVVVADELAFGMLRMLQMLVDDVCVIRPFRSLAEAQVWLQTYESLARTD